MPDLLRKEFDRAVRRAPSAAAIDAPDGRLTFAAIDAWSDRLAAQLTASPSPCAILLAPSTTYYAALVACMKAGRVALPLDPSLPDARLAPMAKALGASLCLTDAGKRQRAQAFAEVLDCGTADPVQAAVAPAPAAAIAALAPPQALHRVLTSGTSGVQTMVTIGREAEVVHAREMGEAYGYRPGTLVANLSRHTSGAGINGFWRGLLSCAGLMACDLSRESFDRVYRRLQQARPVGLQGQPTLLEALAAACAGRPPLKVERLILGGEALTPARLRRIALLLHGDCTVSVNYSSTETMHVACFSAPLAQMLAMTRIPVGRPLPSRRVVLLGEDGAPVAAGAAGEIVVSSRDLALDIEGASSAARFGIDPADPKRRVYRTRDLGRFSDLGLLEHLGRIDRQLKINGIRVDPAAVEAEVERVPGVTRAVVVGVRDAHDRIRLVGCVQRDAAQAPDGALRAALSAQLAAACIPSRWVDVDAFPVGPTGKTDMQALLGRCAAALHDEAAAGAAVPLRSLLRQEWSKALRRPLAANPGSFFDEGGDSLAAAVLATALARFGAGDIDPFWVARHPTLEAQARALGNAAAPELPGGASPGREDITTAAVDRDEILRRIGWL